MGKVKRVYQKSRFTIGQVLREHREYVENTVQFTAHQKRMLRALADCRTIALGAHQIACKACGTVQLACNSCRNRNCPNCQSRDRESWLSARTEELLPVSYFHLVFTLPDTLNDLCLHRPKVMYSLLFESIWYTINKLGKDKRWIGAQVGMIAILHTWGSNLSLHPHLHCMVPAGGLDIKGNWKHSKSKGKYLFNRGVMGSIFRARFVKLMRKAIQKGNLPKVEAELFKKLFEKEWITYAKRPFHQAQQILNYIGRYSHKIAITNHRLLEVSHEKVKFSYKNYRKGGQQEEMTLPVKEFIRRFAMHIVPYKFVRIRHYGILSNRNKKQALKAARMALGKPIITPSSKGSKPVLAANEQPHFCSCCKKVTVHLILDILPPVRGSPNQKQTSKQIKS